MQDADTNPADIETRLPELERLVKEGGIVHVKHVGCISAWQPKGRSRKRKLISKDEA